MAYGCEIYAHQLFCCALKRIVENKSEKYRGRPTVYARYRSTCLDFLRVSWHRNNAVSPPVLYHVHADNAVQSRYRFNGICLCVCLSVCPHKKNEKLLIRAALSYRARRCDSTICCSNVSTLKLDMLLQQITESYFLLSNVTQTRN